MRINDQLFNSKKQLTNRRLKSIESMFAIVEMAWIRNFIMQFEKVNFGLNQLLLIQMHRGNYSVEMVQLITQKFL